MSKERFEPVKGLWSLVKDNETGENVETLETLNALNEENARLKKNLMSEEQGNALSREGIATNLIADIVSRMNIDKDADGNSILCIRKDYFENIKKKFCNVLEKAPERVNKQKGFWVLKDKFSNIYYSRCYHSKYGITQTVCDSIKKAVKFKSKKSAESKAFGLYAYFIAVWVKSFDEEIEDYPSNRDICVILNKQSEQINTLNSKLEETEKKHLLDEKEWQDYCAYKHIEPQIKGCLDREKELEQQLANRDEELKKFKRAGATPNNQEKISLLVEKLEKFRKISDCPANCEYAETGINVVIDDEYFENFIDQLITEIKKLN